MREVLRDFVQDVLPILVTALGAYLANFARQWLKLQADSEAAAVINKAVERVAAEAARQMAAMGTAPNETTRNRAIGAAVSRVEDRVGGAMRRRKVTTADLLGMVRDDMARWELSKTGAGT